MKNAGFTIIYELPMMTTQDFSDFLFKTTAAVAHAEKIDLCVRHKVSTTYIIRLHRPGGGGTDLNHVNT